MLTVRPHDHVLEHAKARVHLLKQRPPLQQGKLGRRIHASNEILRGARVPRILAVLCDASAGVARGRRLTLEAWARTIGVRADLLAHVLALLVKQRRLGLKLCAHSAGVLLLTSMARGHESISNRPGSSQDKDC